MKIIHTSDWHLGQELYSYDRTEEHTAFLEQLHAIVQKEQPDALVVCGDIYHNATPSNSVMRLFTDHMDHIRQACPTMQTIVIAGNHDSPSRLEISAAVWSHLKVHIIGRIGRLEDGSIDYHRHIIPIGTLGYVVALPHVFPHNYPLLKENTPREERQRLFMEAMDQAVKSVNAENLPVVVAAHLAVTGSDTQGHDLTRGGMDFTDADKLGITFDYLALGHIHLSQNIDNGRAHYSGTPIPVSFDENYPHSISIVNIERNRTPDIRTVRIENPWHLRTLPSKAVTLDEAIEALSALPDDDKAYIRLHVRTDGIVPSNPIERAHNATQGKAARFCCFKWVNETRQQKNGHQIMDIEQIKQLTPIEVAEQFYYDEYGKHMDNDLKEMLKQISELRIKN